MTEDSAADGLIRPYKAEDREAVRRISCDTAFMGRPMELFFDDRDILADILTGYYTDYEPESTFIAEFGGKVVGYLSGCKDTKRKEKIFSRVILPKIIFNFMKKGAGFNRKVFLLMFYSLRSLMKGEFKQAAIPKEYPAHLHINIEEEFRKKGFGTRLMQAFFGYLKKNDIHGVHLATLSEQSNDFFISFGFTLLQEAKSSLWQYLLKKDVKTSIFGKRL